VQGAGAKLAHPVDRSEIRQLSIVTSNKTEADVNAPDMNAGKKLRTAGEASEADVTGSYATRPAPQSVSGGSHDLAHGNPPQAMDRWFDEQLNRLFNDVSSEPLPPDLALLVGKLRAQGTKPGDK